MKTRCYLILLLWGVLVWPYFALAQNVGLHFDGDQDFIRAPLASPLVNHDFTAETWFQSDLDSTNACDNWSCPTQFERLFALSGPIYNGNDSRYEVGACQGLLTLYYNSSTGCGSFLPNFPDGICIRDGLWHHVALVKNGVDIRLYLDCVEVFNSSAGWCDDLPANITSFSVGNWGGPPTQNETWDGTVDETRLWNRALSISEIEAVKECRPSTDSDLLIWYDYEEGIVYGNNTNLGNILDRTSNGNDAIIYNMSLNGTESNFVPALGGVIPNPFEGLEVEIRAYPTGPAIHEICDGEPVHFATTVGGISPPADASLGEIEWEYNYGAGWMPATNPPYLGWNFPIPQGFFQANCSSNAQGYTDLTIRAIARSTSLDTAIGGLCEVISPPYDLRICCPITTAEVVVVPDTPICAGSVQDFVVDLDAQDPFIQQLGVAASVVWSYELNGNGHPISPLQLPFTQSVDLTSISEATELCFIAEVSNCNKTKTFRNCISVDVPPVCGELNGISTSLALIQSIPHKVYELCPYDDAVLEFTGDQHCKKRWQYSFDLATWTDEGSFSNPQLNTNVIPWDFFWQNGADKVFYRVVCEPEQPNSGCPPKVCEMVEIRLVPTPDVPVINVPALLCEEDLPVTLSVLNPINAGSYEWYKDGLVVGTGEDLIIEEEGCYRVQWNGTCTALVSDIQCVQVCEINAVISCPQPQCVLIGREITLNALKCTSSCDSSVLTYSWWIDGVPAGNSDMIIHTPADQGTTYTLEVVDTTSGCSATVSQTIVPCEN